MYAATFVFAKKQFDETFYQLDAVIAAAARSLPGYLGEDNWENPSTGLVATVYYWSTLEALQALMHHPSHVQAKAAQARWLDGYHVTISQVLHSYGDNKLVNQGNLAMAQIVVEGAPDVRAR